MTQEKRLKDAKAAAKASDIRVFQTHYGWWHDTGGYASLHPRLRATRFARAFDLSGRAAVFMICFGVFFLAFETEDVGCVVVEVCFDDDFC